MSSIADMVPGTYNEVSTTTGKLSTAVFITEGEPIFGICRTDLGDWKCELTQLSAMELFQFFDWLQTEYFSDTFVKENGNWAYYSTAITDPDRWPLFTKTISGRNSSTINVVLVKTDFDKKWHPYYTIKIAWPNEENALEDIIIDCTLHELSILSMMLLLFISNCPMYYSSIHNNISKKIGDWVASGSKDTFQTYIHNHQQRATDFLRHSSDPC